MTFRSYDFARRNLMRTGLGAAPIVVALHACPAIEENPVIGPSEHTEQRGFDPSMPTGAQLQWVPSGSTSITSSDRFVTVEPERIGGRMTIGGRVVGQLR